MNFQVVINLSGKDELVRFSESIQVADRLSEKTSLLQELERLNKEIEALRKEVENLRKEKSDTITTKVEVPQLQQPLQLPQGARLETA